MKIISIIKIALLLFCTSLAFSIEVDKQELETADENKTVKFENYTASSSWVNSLKGIKNIGVSIGWPVAEDRAKQQTVGNKNRYAVIHAIDPDEKSKFDADIIIFGSGSAVDHINNVRHIIAAYLTAAYDYSDTDAFTIAILVTVYNAIYRGNIDFFTKKYKAIVTTNLEESKCGLSLSYKDWPGKSQIVIPLSDGTTASLNTVNLAAITEKNVVDAVIEDPSVNIPITQSVADTNPIDVKSRIESLKKRAKIAQTALRLERRDQKLPIRIALFAISALLMVAGLTLLAFDISIHKKINDISDKDLLLSSTETNTYIDNFTAKRSVVIAACALNTIALVMTLLSLLAVAFIPPSTPFIIAMIVMLAAGAAGIGVLITMVSDLHKRFSAVSMAKINPPGVDTDPDPTIIGEPVVITTSSTDPMLTGGNK